MSTPNETLQHVRNLIESYQSTVYALLAFAALVVHDGQRLRENAQFGFGRRMRTSDTNPVAPSEQVTPDLVAQKSLKYGVVAEVKRTLSNDPNQWEVHLVQLRKYDDELQGWWTADEVISRSDVAMLIHQSRSRRFLRFVEGKLKENPQALGSSTAIIEFVQSQEADVFMFFRCERGKVADDELASALADGTSVPLLDVLRSFSSVRFYDARPPVHMLLDLLWSDVFLALSDPAAYDEELKAIPIPVTVDQITLELQRAYGSGALESGSRSAAFPKRAWVREALETLVSVKLARRGSQSGEYTILYRTFRDDVLERFVKLTGEDVGKGEEAQDQMTLFPGEEQEE